MSDRLVSILTPCYNTAHLLWRLLDSVLNQTYPYIEMFIIDDGSSDNTRELYERYSEKFHAKGYVLNYIYQENQGQSAAINNGLKLINGEFLVWPDSDDYYASPKAIESMVNCLIESSDDVGMVRTQEMLVDEVSLKEISIHGITAKEYEDKSLFEDCLFHCNGFYFPPGAYMVKTEVLRQVVGESIYTHKDAGQNWQLYLPILYSYRCRTIMAPLYNVLCRESSHSRNTYRGYEREVHKYNIYEQTILETLCRIKEMPLEECQKYQQQITVKYARIRLDLAYKYRQREDYIQLYKPFAKESYKLPFQYKLYYRASLIGMGKVFEIIAKIKSLLLDD